MKSSQAIYIINSLARKMEIDGCEEIVEALLMARDCLFEKSSNECLSRSVKRKNISYDERFGLTHKVKISA